ncbi:MAG: acyltransferase family protein, partial [Gammaproteobacteria bacterium]
MTAFAPKTLFTIQALRALAASSVVAYHVLFMMVHRAGYSFSFPHTGACGVDLFFVISGFIMVYTTNAQFGQPNASKAFIRRRLIRIVPIYWLYTTMIVLLLAFSPRLFSEAKFEWVHVISSYLFLLSKNANGEVGTVVQTGWTLCFEMYFYVLFALLIMLPRRYFLGLSGSIFLTGLLLNQANWSVPVWATVAMDPILFEFYLGSVIGFAFLRGFYLTRYIAVAAIILGILVILASFDITINNWTRVACWGLPGGLIVFGAVSLDRLGMRVPKFLASLGDSSYSLYLAHPFIVSALGKAWTALHLYEKMPPALLFIL